MDHRFSRVRGTSPRDRSTVSTLAQLLEQVECALFDACEGEATMLRSMKDLEECSIRATDGTIGHVKDLYFDDATWVIRYLVVDTGTWLSSRKVLISPISIGDSNWMDKVLPVALTKEQVKNSPDIDTDKPVSRQHEVRYLGYYGYPYYWGGAGLWAEGSYPGPMITSLGYGPADAEYRNAQQARAAAEAQRHQDDDDPRLRSCNTVAKYHIAATDGEIGHVHGMLVDEKTWAIRYLVVNTSNWWLGHEVLIAPTWITDVSWVDATVSVNLTRQSVKDAPPYKSAAPLQRAQEIGIYSHYGHAGYWVDEDKREPAISP